MYIIMIMIMRLNENARAWFYVYNTQKTVCLWQMKESSRNAVERQSDLICIYGT